jgi:hypothetical protein
MVLDRAPATDDLPDLGDLDLVAPSCSCDHGPAAHSADGCLECSGSACFRLDQIADKAVEGLARAEITFRANVANQKLNRDYGVHKSILEPVRGNVAGPQG